MVSFLMRYMATWRGTTMRDVQLGMLVLAKSINSLADYLQAHVGPKDLSIDDCQLAAWWCHRSFRLASPLSTFVPESSAACRKTVGGIRW